MSDGVNRELFQESVNNINNKLDTVNSSIGYISSKLEDTNNKLNNLHIDLTKIENKLKTTTHEVGNLRSDTDDLKKSNTIIDNDKKWITIIFGAGWSVVLILTKVFVDYKIDKLVESLSDK